MSHEPAYGLWSLVVINAAVFIFFALSFAKPRSARDWRSFGAFSAFLVAPFAEMYGFPLTLYRLSGRIGQRFPQLDPHVDPLHITSHLLIGLGFRILSASWPVLYRAQREGRLATKGPCSRVRHPQYLGFMYVRLALREEAEVGLEFGSEYQAYARKTPRWLPAWRSFAGGGLL